MKLTTSTIEILNNFARINNNVLLKEGNEFYTREPTGKSVIGLATVPEKFPQEIAIHDLTSLLQYIKLAGNEPDIDVDGEYLLINGGGTKIKYRLADKDTIICMDKRPTINEDPFATIELDEDSLQTILVSRNVGVTKADTVEFFSDGAGFYVKIMNEQNPAANIVTKELEGKSENPMEFSIKFRDDQFPMIVQDYTIGLYERKIGEQSAFFAMYSSDGVEYLTTAKQNAGCYVKEM